MSLPQPPEQTAQQLMAGLARVLAGTYAGRDPAGLVTATVDGEGYVVDVVFAPLVTRYDTRAVESAIRLAVAAAQRSITDAFARLTNPPPTIDSPPTTDPAGPAVVGAPSTVVRFEDDAR